MVFTKSDQQNGFLFQTFHETIIPGKITAVVNLVLILECLIIKTRKGRLVRRFIVMCETSRSQLLIIC